MVYSELLSDPEGRKAIFREEFGIDEALITPRVVVSPIPLDTVFPEDYREILEDEGISFQEYVPEDHILTSWARNLLVEEKGLILVLGRGLVEFTDRLRILLTSDVREILFVGSTAGIQGVETGEIVAPRAAIPFENVSEIYVDVTRHLPLPDRSLYEEITGYGVKEGVHATVPLFYMETIEFLGYLKEIGVNTLDMELSAFFRLVRAYSKRGVALLRVSDLPLAREHFWSEEHEMKRDRKEASKRKLLELSLKFLGVY